MASRQQSDAASPRSLKGKVAIVTASTDGIGLAVARRLGQDGAKVTVSSRNEENVKRAVETLRGEGLDVLGVTCHVAKADQRADLIEGTLSHFGKIDILVSNAAVNPALGHFLTDFEESAWDKIFDVNLKSSFLLAKEVYPHMVKQPSGRIVFVSTIGAYSVVPGNGGYIISKVALLGLTKVLAAELGKDNITVNCLAPGLVKTNFASKILGSDAKSDYSVKRIPLGRAAVPEEMAGTVSFLCSDDARYITGETIVNAGGLHSHL